MEIRNCIFSEIAEKKHLHRVDSHCKKDKAYIHTWYKNLCWNHQWMQTIWWEYIETGTVMVVVWCNRRIPSRVKRRKEGEDVDPWVRAPSPSCGQSGNLAIWHLQEVKTIYLVGALVRSIYTWSRCRCSWKTFHLTWRTLTDSERKGGWLGSEEMTLMLREEQRALSSSEPVLQYEQLVGI